MVKIISESSVAAGVRRIEAYTGARVEEMIYTVEDTMRDMSALHNPPVLPAVSKMFESDGRCRSRSRPCAASR